MQSKSSTNSLKNPPKDFLEGLKYVFDERSRAIEKMWAQINTKPKPYKKGKKRKTDLQTG